MKSRCDGHLLLFHVRCAVRSVGLPAICKLSEMLASRALRSCSYLGVRYQSANAGKSTSAAAPVATTTEAEKERQLDFSNTREAYRSKTFLELLRHYAVFKVFSYQLLVDNNKLIIEQCKKFFGEKLFVKLMKSSVYGQFVAGEDLTSIKPAIERLRESGVRSILDYAVEKDVKKEEEVVMETRHKDPFQVDAYPTDPHTKSQFKPHRVKAVKPVTQSSARTHFYTGEEQCEENVKFFKSCIKMAANANSDKSRDPFAAIKLTGLGRVEFLLRFSEVMVNNHNIFLTLADSPDILTAHITPHSFNSGLNKVKILVTESQAEALFRQLSEDNVDGKLNVFEFCHRFQPGTELHSLFRNSPASSLSSVLRHSEKQQMEQVVSRAQQLADYAQELGVRLLVDAEQTYFQPAIRYIAVNILMPKYNLDTPTIYSTVQCYLKEAEFQLRMELATADLTGCLYGVKLVRGAYMEQERERAGESDYEDPIWPNKVATDDCYHKLMDFLLQEKATRPASTAMHMMIASHNEDTIRLATDKMKQYKIPSSDRGVAFGQLLGMCDHVTFPLGQANYGAYKYMPYGPVQEVLPYLSRRANENRGIFKGAQRERQLVSQELARRLKFWDL